jgi:alkaline phosphatase D
VDNDYAADRDERGTPPEVFLLRRAAAYQAYYEAMPLRAASVPSGPNMLLYRRLTFGRLLDLSVLDTRQWRVQACSGSLQRDCAPPSDPRRSMLGREQEQWLFDNLTDATSIWTVLGQQVPTFPLGALSMDKWDGYAASRERLYTRLLDSRAPNPVVLSGDVHVHYGSDLMLDFADSRSPTVGVELTNSSVTSNGDGADVSGDWERVRVDNPHVKFHSGRRGYIACTATRDTLRAEFRIVQKVTVPDQPVQTSGSFVVEAGHPGLQRA